MSFLMHIHMKTAAIIAAAGLGKRMGGNQPKQYLEVGGRPIICHTLDRFATYGIHEMIVVVEPGREGPVRDEIIRGFGYPSSWKVVPGGEVRQRSVYNGLGAVSGDVDVVLVHDGVRPYVTVEQIVALAELAFREGACILAERMKDTVKRAGHDGSIVETVDRKDLWRAQTPQAFRRELLIQAMESAFKDEFVGTDDASLVERLGRRVFIVEGESRNIKITTPEDLLVAEAIQKEWNG